LERSAFKKAKKIILKFSIADDPNRFLDPENLPSNFIKKILPLTRKSKLNGIYLMLITEPLKFDIQSNCNGAYLCEIVLTSVDEKNIPKNRD